MKAAKPLNLAVTPTEAVKAEAAARPVRKSSKLNDVCYDIRGPVLTRARQMEDEGHKIIKLNIGNLAAFGFDAPEEIQMDMIRNLPNSAGYSDSKGIFSARKAVMHYTQQKNIKGVDIEDIYIGNGVSELIVMAMNALLNAGDEVLVPAPDYPLWTAAVSLSGGRPVHYLCDEGSGWLPDIADMRAKITPNTRAIVVINPNNPTGAVYPDEVLKEIIALAREHDLILYSDEVYDKVLYDGVTHTSLAALSEDVLTIIFNGLSKNYRACGYRAGWMVVCGDKRRAADYIEGLNTPSRPRWAATRASMIWWPKVGACAASATSPGS
jgi:alanine-synthesizing transaminase